MIVCSVHQVAMCSHAIKLTAENRMRLVNFDKCAYDRPS